jgi:oligopeptide transport system substrate-binding protein
MEAAVFRFKRVKAAFCAVVLAFVLFGTSCSEKDGSGYLFKSSLMGNPKILDPQIASDESSLVVIGNMFCGLLRVSGDGKLAEGVASSYTVSDDGLKYVFSLKNNFYWHGPNDYKKQVTAEDFVFAFKRIFDKSTKSPYTSTFLCIKNASKIISGEMTPDSLGVKANGNFELEFELDYPNANFLSLLATSAAMPCNEEFFKSTKGKYGLDDDSCISNGGFYLKEWQYDPYGENNYIIMRKNSYFSAVYPVYPSGLNFFIEKNEENIESDFLAGNTDCIISGTNKKLLKSDCMADEYETAASGFVYNLKSETFSNKSLREALSLCVDRSAYADELSGSSAAYGIIPSGVTMLNKSYRELVSEKDKSVFNLELAKQKWNEGLSAIGKMTILNVNILVPQSFEDPERLKYITQQWQNGLGFFCGLEVVPDGEYRSRILSGDYEIAVLEISGTYNSPEAILNNFKTSNSSNIIRYSNPEFDRIMDESGRSKSLNECVKLYSQAEKLVIDDAVYTPLFYEKEYFIYRKTIEGIGFNPFTKQIDFCGAKNFK